MKERIVRYTKDEIKKLKGKTDLGRVRKTSDEEIKQQVEHDPDSYLPSDEELKKFKPANKEDKP